MITKNLLSIIISLFSLIHFSAFAGFTFGDLTQDGSGSFNQPIAKSAFANVGTIPVGVNNLTVSLASNKDIDIQLWDVDANKPIVGWNIGALIGSIGMFEKTSYNGITIAYSGFNGDGTGLGHEYIKITGVTKNKFLIKAFGYIAGDALVNYSWKGVSNISDSGYGSFSQYINQGSKIQLNGTIPNNVSNVTISLSAATDIDIELYDAKTGTFVVGWNGGKISSSNMISGTYNGDKITWSGWNGRASDYGKDMAPSNGNIPQSEFGKEWIKISGTLKNSYVMKVFGFNNGKASVNYSWGNNLIYAGIAGTGPKAADENKNPNSFEFKNGMLTSNQDYLSKIFGSSLAADGYINTDYQRVANNWRWGMLGMTLRISAMAQGGGDVIAYDDGHATWTFLNLKERINLSAKSGGVTSEAGNKIYISGHSNGGSDAKDISWKLSELNYLVRGLFLIDAYTNTDMYSEYIPTNVRNAMSFYESEVYYNWFLVGKLKITNSLSTTATNTKITNPVGDSPGSDAHNRIDNDPRVYDAIINFIIKDYSSFQKGFGSLTFL